MVNYIWVGMTVIGVVFAMFNGTMDEVNEGVICECKGGGYPLYWTDEHTCILAGVNENCGGIGIT